MKKKRMLIFVACFSLCVLHCGGSSELGGTETGNAADGVNQAVGGSLDLVSASLGAEANGLTASFRRPPADSFSFSLLSSAYADVTNGACSDSDTAITVTATCSEVAHTAEILRDFGRGCEADNGVIITGKSYVSWFNMGEGACVSATRRPRFLKAVRGNQTKQLISTDVLASTGSCDSPSSAVIRNFAGGGELQVKGCRTLSYSNVRVTENGGTLTEQLEFQNVSRVRYRASGAKLFDHTVSTPTPLTITFEKEASKTFPVRTISTGEVQVVHNLAGYMVRSSYNNVVYDYNQCDCHPIRGTLSVTVTETATGQELGSGTVTFTAADTGVCDSMNATYQGQTISLPLGNCRGI